MLGERALLEAEDSGPFSGPLDRAAAALVAVGALSEQLAGSVVADYGLACALRGRRRAWAWPRGAGAVVPVPFAPARVLPGPIALTVQGWEMTVRWVRFGDDQTELAVSGRRAAGRPRRSRTPSTGPPPSLQVADDRGTSATCHFSGGHGDGDFSGTFATATPLSADTAWLDVSGQRVELPVASTPRAEVRVEPLPARPAGLGYLWHELAVSDSRFHRPGGETSAALDALVAVGAVDADDPEVKALVQVGAALQGGTGARINAPPGLPEPWAAFLGQGSPAAPPGADGVTGVASAGVVAGPVDGAYVGIDAIEAQPHGFSVEVVVSPGTALRARFEGVSGRAIEWWAKDDLGVLRLGHVGDSGGSRGKMRGTVEFTPGLDAEARMLHIMPTGRTERAVVSVVLPWADAPSAAQDP